MTAIEFTQQLSGMEQSLMKYALRFRLGYDDSRDLVQETFLKAILNRDKFVDTRYIKAWTFTIMRNTFINNYRHNDLHKSRFERKDDLLPIIQTKMSDSGNPDSAYSVIEINQHIEQLKNSLKIPFKMYVDGFMYKEIAEKMNIKIGTVKSRIYLARQELRNQLDL
jgi:RNA polymerase sigma-70 factor (ECF subfamily)